jgi:hypothetical protein
MVWLKIAIGLATVAVAAAVLWITVVPLIRPAHTVAYYIAHPAERNIALAYGINHPGNPGLNYRAALEAKYQADSAAFLASVPH